MTAVELDVTALLDQAADTLGRPQRGAVLKPLAMALFRRGLTIFFRCLLVSTGGRPHLGRSLHSEAVMSGGGVLRFTDRYGIIC